MAVFDVVAKRGKAFIKVGRVRLNINGFGRLEMNIPFKGTLSVQPAQEPDNEATVPNRPRVSLPSIR